MSEISDIAESVRNLTDFTNAAATLAKMLLASAEQTEPIDADRWDQHLEAMLDKLPGAIDALHVCDMSLDEATRAARGLYQTLSRARQQLADGVPIREVFDSVAHFYHQVIVGQERFAQRLIEQTAEASTGQRSTTPATEPDLSSWLAPVRGAHAPAVEPESGPQYVTRDQIASLVQRNKDTVADWFNKDRNAPKPAVEGGGGKRHEYLWNDELRSWLMNKSGRIIQPRFPSLLPGT